MRQIVRVHRTVRGVLGAGLTAGLLVTVTMGSAAAQADDPPTAGDDVELQRVEVPEASLALALPSDWTVEAGLDYSEFDFGDPEVGHIGVVSGEGPDGAGCELHMYGLSELALPEVADTLAFAHGGSETTTEVTAIELPVGEAYRVDVQEANAAGHEAIFLWTTDVARYQLSCSGPAEHEGLWGDVAATLEWLPGSRQAQALAGGIQRVEVPEAGVALSLPGDFRVDLDPVPYLMSLPPDGVRATPVTTVLLADSPAGVSCGLETFEGNPLPLEEHVAWVEQVNLEQPDFEGSIGHVAVSLPAGEALRIDGDHQGDHVWTTMYLFDVGDTRYQLYCLDRERAPDDYRSIAESVELLEEAPPAERPEWVPDEAVAWDVVTDYVTQVPVSDDEEGGLVMAASCERALWLEYANGTFEERLLCALTDDPVEPPEFQGTPPAETRIFSGGACEWYSDYWYLTDGSERWADSWSMSVTPDGVVLGVAIYAAEAVDCSS